MGEYPREILERGQLALNITLPESLPAGLPSTLLERRPDLRAAERRLAAAMADVGVNYANRFPNLRLAFTPGFENDALSKFFESPFTYSIVSPPSKRMRACSSDSSRVASVWRTIASSLSSATRRK